MPALPPCCASVALFVFVGFSDDRRLALVIRFGVAVFVFVIIGVSRRNRVAHVGDEAPVDRGEVLGDALGHVGSLLDVATVMRGRYHAGPGVQQKGRRDKAPRRRQPEEDEENSKGHGNARTAARQCRIIIGNLAGQRNDLD